MENVPRNYKKVSNKVVLMALKSFALHANPVTGILDSDKREIIEIFTILKMNNEYYDPSEVESWLISRANWTPKLAAHIAGIAKGILEGKRFTSRHKGPMFNENIIEVWREEARDPTKNSEEFHNTH